MADDQGCDETDGGLCVLDDKRRLPMISRDQAHTALPGVAVDINRIQETIVSVYLTARKGLFINPQMSLQLDGKEVLPDFIALDPPGKRVWLVEVTWAAKGEKILRKCREYARNKAEIRQALGPSCPADWSLGVWLFLTSETAAVVAGKANGFGDMIPRIDTLEHAAAVWTWSRSKHHTEASNTCYEGEEPAKPD